MSIEWQVRWSTWPTNWPNNEAPNYPVTWFAFEQRPIKNVFVTFETKFIFRNICQVRWVTRILSSALKTEKCPLVRFIDAFSSSFFCAEANIFKRNSTVCPGPGNEERGLLWMRGSSEVKFSFDQGLKSPCLASTMPFLLIVMSHNMLSRHQMEWRNFPSQNAD